MVAADTAGTVAGAARVDGRDAARLAYLGLRVDCTLTDWACKQSRLAYPGHGSQAVDAAVQDSSLGGEYYFSRKDEIPSEAAEYAGDVGMELHRC